MSTRRYNYKLRPGSKAIEQLRYEYTLARWVWNECVHQYRSGNKPNLTKLCAMLTAARGHASWLRAGSSVVQQQEIRTYLAALKHSFTVPGRGRPRLKTRKNSPYASLNYTKRSFRIKDNRLVLAGGNTIPVVWSRELPSEPTSVRVYEDAVGDWWASFVIKIDDNELIHPTAPPTALGIDWGITTTATTTDPALDLEFEDITAQHARNLKKYQRRMALHKLKRDKAETQAYNRAKMKAAREHRAARYQREGRGRQWANQVAKTHRFVAAEDFKPKFLAATTMAKKMHNAAIGTFKHYLQEAVTKQGGTYILVPPHYSTMTCSSCATRAKQRLELNIRVFTCHDCGFTENRDRNAALNIRQWAGFNPTIHNGSQPATLSSIAAS